MLKIILPILLLSNLGCAIFRRSIDPKKVHVTDSGFKFKFPMSGKWYPAKSKRGQFMVGQEPEADGTSRIAYVEHASFSAEEDIRPYDVDVLKSIRGDVEADARTGRVKNVKTLFNNMRFRGANCMHIHQTGQDPNPKQVMDINSDSLVCIHPTKSAMYIWMSISERRPEGKPLSIEFKQQEKDFFSSLEVVKSQQEW